MIEIAAGDSLVVRVAPYAEGEPTDGAARIAVAAADPALAAALTSAITGAVARLEAAAPGPPVVRLRSRKALAQDPGRLAGAIAILAGR